MTRPLALSITTAHLFGHTHTDDGVLITRDLLRLARLFFLVGGV